MLYLSCWLTERPYVRLVTVRNICQELRTHVVGSANNLYIAKTKIS